MTNAKVTWKGKVLSAVAQTAGKHQIHIEAEDILTVAIPRTPFRRGVLRASGHVSDVENGSVIAFSTPYAEKQHEDTSLYHSEGEAKYLENPLNERADGAIERIGLAIGAAIKAV